MSTINPKYESLRRARLRTVMVVGCLAAIASGATFAATAPAELPAVTVKYGDLNLSTHEGVQKLYGRIAQAARTVCETQNRLDPKAVAASRSCESAAISRAVSDVNNPGLAATFANRVSRG
jgi:UrcA family protein